MNVPGKPIGATRGRSPGKQVGVVCLGQHGWVIGPFGHHGRRRRGPLATRSQIAFARGACGGVRITWMPSASKTQHGVDVQEVTSDDPMGLGREFSPGRATALWHASPAAIAERHPTVAAMAGAAESAEPTAFVHLNGCLHAQVAAFSRNALLRSIYTVSSN